MSRFVAAESLEQALELLARGGAAVLAGGTDLMVRLRRAKLAGGRTPETLLDVTGLKELNRLDLAGDEPYLGAAVTFARLAADRTARALYPVLAQAAASVGSVQIRHLGTIGGNAANASPAADGVSALTALGAAAEIASPQGRRLCPIEELIAAPYRNALRTDELILGFRLDRLPKGTSQRFAKVGRRRAVSVARLNVAVCLDKDLKRPRVVLGSCFPSPRRLTEVEALLAAGPAGPELWLAAGRKAAGNFTTICGWRASASYKVPAVARFVAATLAEAWAGLESEP